MQDVLLRKRNRLRVVLAIELIRPSVAVEIDNADLEPVDARPPVTSFPALHLGGWLNQPQHSDF
jgi:hypothetical protein